MFRIGIDTGGTFTDCVVFNTNKHTLKRYKTPSTPRNYSEGVIKALKIASEDHNLTLQQEQGKTMGL